MIDRIRHFFERNGFGVFSRLADGLGMRAVNVRLYFIYTSFISMGSPIIIYLFVAFWLNVKKYIKRGKNMIWE